MHKVAYINGNPKDARAHNLVRVSDSMEENTVFAVLMEEDSHPFGRSVVVFREDFDSLRAAESKVAELSVRLNSVFMSGLRTFMIQCCDTCLDFYKRSKYE